MRKHRRKSRSKKKISLYPSFRFGIDEIPPWMHNFISTKYAIPCCAKVFGPNNHIIHQKWMYIGNQEKQLASKGDCITLTREGTLRVIQEKSS